MLWWACLTMSWSGRLGWKEGYGKKPLDFVKYDECGANKGEWVEWLGN